MMNETIAAPRLVTATTNETYSVRLAETSGEIRAAQTLRFNVFNLELNEGLESSYATRTDTDQFDTVCDPASVKNVTIGRLPPGQGCLAWHYTHAK